MNPPKVFNCARCDAEMEVRSFQEGLRVTCRSCGHDYRLHYSEAGKAWQLQPESAAEPESEQRRTEEPAGVLAEVGRPKRVDRSEQFREQSDLQADTDQAIDKEHRNG